MSGGSYNYLHQMWDLEDAESKLEELERMALRLEGLSETEFPGCGAAAEMTRAFILKIETWQKHVNATVKHLGPVWKGVEWWDSCDWSSDQVRAELDELIGGKDGS